MRRSTLSSLTQGLALLGVMLMAGSGESFALLGTAPSDCRRTTSVAGEQRGGAGGKEGLVGDTAVGMGAVLSAQGGMLLRLRGGKRGGGGGKYKFRGRNQRFRCVSMDDWLAAQELVLTLDSLGRLKKKTERANVSKAKAARGYPNMKAHNLLRKGARLQVHNHPLPPSPTSIPPLSMEDNFRQPQGIVICSKRCPIQGGDATEEEAKESDLPKDSPEAIAAHMAKWSTMWKAFEVAAVAPTCRYLLLPISMPTCSPGQIETGTGSFKS